MNPGCVKWEKQTMADVAVAGFQARRNKRGSISERIAGGKVPRSSARDVRTHVK
jgi:hypothetical protein